MVHIAFNVLTSEKVSFISVTAMYSTSKYEGTDMV